MKRRSPKFRTPARRFHACCPSCKRQRARRSYEQFRFGISRYKCRNCGEVFFVWQGKTWVHPEQDGELRAALVSAGELEER